VFHLTKQLNLTSDQQSKIKPILENQAEQMQKLHQDSSLSQQDRMSKMREIHQNTTSQIRETLTPDQQQKLDAMKANREEHHHGQKTGQAQPQ
jgi:Spy/CpxP family protein refolding chaperone